ncbi:long-chain fatty acid--CoA ligase [Pullulanibacillus sp. KACC 23026]|uniref:long-chain-fatty-acid--CoA ligase n=1 Tax=Pullulanibacillus sp. KACC 23026 TaxID=3028315 RepID=UPI0023B0D001|nr:long-chain fatty acid--CoA ligase [Pullulanibacillus sp. KACC 23026]WEG12045.1 long-chain fatty acid--CoA ligase [Pullulanibacillus sp. KACC 23026]
MLDEPRPWLNVYDERIVRDLPASNESMNDLLKQAVQKYKKDVALTFYNQTFTYEQVQGIVEQFAQALYKSGFRKGDRLAVMLPNCPQSFFSLFAVFRLGGIVVQVNPMYVEREIEYVLKDSEATSIMALDAFYPKIKSVQPKTPSLKQVIVSSFSGKLDFELSEGDYLLEDFLKTTDEQAPEIEINALEDVAVLQYTGGTTGVSKGVMLTHANLRSNVEQVYEFSFKTLDYPYNAKIMTVLPLFHIYGLTCNAFQGIRTGANQILLPRFDPIEILETVSKHEVFSFSGVPTMYVALNAQKDIENSGLTKIRLFNSGGAAMPLRQLHLFEQRTRSQLYEGFGLSECSPVTHSNPVFTDRRAGSIGIPLPGTTAAIVREGENGLEVLPAGEVGELAIKGPQVMKGYWRRPEATAEVLKEGWLLTGDLARMDEDGYFYIVDRKKDMIIASGYNVYPREIEEVLYEHPAIQETVVIGVPDAYRGETVKAYVTLKPGQSVTEDEIIAFAKERLSPYKVPKIVEFRDELPKSAVGKLLKRELRDEDMKKQSSLDQPTDLNR